MTTQFSQKFYPLVRGLSVSVLTAHPCSKPQMNRHHWRRLGPPGKVPNNCRTISSHKSICFDIVALKQILIKDYIFIQPFFNAFRMISVLKTLKLVNF